MKKIARIQDNFKADIVKLLEGKINKVVGVKFQGLKGEYTLTSENIKGVSKEYLNAFEIEYTSVLSGVKISQLKNYSKIEFAKYIDCEIDSFNAQLDSINVKVIRENGLTNIYCQLELLAYYD